MNVQRQNISYINAPPQRYSAGPRIHPENGLNGGGAMIDNYNAPNLVNRALGYGGGNSGGGYTIRRSFNDYGGIQGGMQGFGHGYVGEGGYNFRLKMGRQVEKSRGLRHFSQKVCEKVKEKGQTNYNEVANELVEEYFDSLAEPPTNIEKQEYDTKNIRRRVYDALNVLMAMNIIEKEKKEIHWVGLPTSSLAECRRMEEEKAQRQEKLRQKTEQLQDLIIQLVTYKSLVQKNREREREMGRANESSLLYLPYIIVSTDKKTIIDCSISPDKSEYWFNFDRHFEIHDDIEVLKRMGLAYGLDCGDVPIEHIPHIKSCLPAALRDYVDQIIEGHLSGGVISKTGKGSQTVVISTNQQDRKPAVKYPVVDARINMPNNYSSGGISVIGNNVRAVPHQGNAPVARYTVIPRSVNPNSRYSGQQSVQQVLYGGRSGGMHPQQRQYMMQDTSVGHRTTPQQHRGYSSYQNQQQYHGGMIQAGPEDEYLEGEEVYEEEENLDYN